MLDDIVADNIAQGIGIPIPATQDSLLPPRTRIASRLRAHPAGLALLIAEQTFKKQPCVPRNTFLPEQRTYPLLNLPKRRSPQRKRLFNRRCLRPRSSNHGCPWIQKSSERATVMLAPCLKRGLRDRRRSPRPAPPRLERARSPVRPLAPRPIRPFPPFACRRTGMSWSRKAAGS